MTSLGDAPVSLWRHRDFLKLWGGDAASQIGAQLAIIAIPVLAVEVLSAGEFEIGLLGAAQTLAFLVIGLPAGAWVDRWLKRQVMLRADLVRAVALALVPALWLLGVLEMWHLIVIAAVVGGATVFFDVAYQSYIPILVPRSAISDANSKLEATAQTARVGGPAVGGFLLTVIAAPLILAANALTYLVSFAALLTIRDSEVRADPAARRPLHQEIAEGVRFVAGNRLLRRITLCTASGNLFQIIATTMIPVLVLRDLGLSPAVLGVTTSIGAIGGILGAFATARIARAIGEGTAIPVAAIVLGVGLVLLPLMAFLPDAAIPILLVAELLISVGVLVYNITQVSFRQRICPPALLGRMNASIRFFVWGVMPIGGLLSGVLGTTIGLVPTMIIGSVGALLSAGFVVFSPLLGMRKLPDAVDPVDAVDELDQPIGAGGTEQ